MVFEGRQPFAEEHGEGPLFLSRKGLEESCLIRYMCNQRNIYQFATLFSQFDQNAASVFWISNTPHQSFFCQAVDAIGHRPRRHHHRAKECCGRELVWWSCTTQGC